MRHIFFVFLLLGVMVLGFEAGKRGFYKDTQETPVILFRSLPLFSNPPRTSEKITSEQKPETVIDSKKPEKKEDKEEEKPKEDKDKRSSIEEDKETETEKIVKDSFLGVHRENDAMLLFLDQQNQTKSKEKSTGRVKTLPQFSTLYIPVYVDNQLGPQALQDFSQAFHGQSAAQKIFVLEKETTQGRYQVQVYDRGGKHFLGSFETMGSQVFPFLGIPQFFEYQDEHFTKSSRFLIVSDTDRDISNFLNHEPYLQSILRSAYRAQLDTNTFVGRHKTIHVNIYTIFPGVFLAVR